MTRRIVNVTNNDFRGSVKFYLMIQNLKKIVS